MLVMFGFCSEGVHVYIPVQVAGAEARGMLPGDEYQLVLTRREPTQP